MKDLQLIEKLVVEYGRTITHEEIKKHLNQYSDINKKISSLIGKGLLVNLRRGVYYISKIGTLGYTSSSNYLIANAIGQESFVSFEAALKYHNCFDQGLRKYRSISQQQYLEKKLEGITYQYTVVGAENYFGFNLENVDGGQARIATKERALLDLIEYHRSVNSVSLALEKIAEQHTDLNLKLLAKYLHHYSQVTIKTLGLLFDIAQLETSFILELINGDSVSKMFSTAETFNSKWRLYYPEVLAE